MKYDYVARITFEAEDYEDALAVRDFVNEKIADAMPTATALQSSLYNTSAADTAARVEKPFVCYYGGVGVPHPYTLEPGQEKPLDGFCPIHSRKMKEHAECPGPIGPPSSE